MSRELVTLLKKSFDHSHSLLVQFINECPEKIWAQSYSGFHTWQHVYHAFGAYEFFIKDEKNFFLEGLFGADEEDVLLFKKIPSTLNKETTLAFMEAKKNAVDKFWEGITDKDLPKKHQGFSSRYGKDKTYLELLALITSHNMYHLGACDSALRGNGLKGIY